MCLLPFGTALTLGMTCLLAVETARLMTLETAHLLALDALHLRRREITAAVAAAAALGFDAGATPAAATMRHFEAGTATAIAVAAATAPRSRRGRTAATVAIAVAIATAATAVAAGSRTCRGCDRQRGDAGSEKHPGQHVKSPLEPNKRSVRCTVPTLERMELAA